MSRYSGLSQPQMAYGSYLIQCGHCIEYELKIWLPQEIYQATGLKFFHADIAILGTRQLIEVDGYEHRTAEGRRHDAQRDRILSSLGWKVQRVTNEQALAAGQNLPCWYEVSPFGITLTPNPTRICEQIIGL